MDTEAFVEGVAQVYVEWNATHPFPEGNGRVLNTMLSQLAWEAGHEIDFRRMPSDFWLDAAEKSLQRLSLDNPRRMRPADTSEIKELFEYITDPRPEKFVALEAIRAKAYEQADRTNVQAAVMLATQKDPQWFIEEYERHPESVKGRYVAADLFKETFQECAASKESRNRHNDSVHNSAVILSSALFKQNLKDNREPARGRGGFSHRDAWCR